jgi:hypothetical protein
MYEHQKKHKPYLPLLFLGIFMWSTIDATVDSASANSASTSQTTSLPLLRESSPVNNDEMAILQESKPLVTRAGAWHTWNDHIHLKAGQERIHLVLTFANGSDGRAKFTDLRVRLDRKSFATLKDFDGADILSCNLTNKLTKGNSALEVQGFGPSGARLKWTLFIQRPTITTVKPNPLSSTDTVHIEGSNFSAHDGDLKVLVDTKPAKLLAIKNNEVQLKLPAHIPGGSRGLKVVVNSVESKPFSVFVKGNPQINWVNMLASPPGQPVTLSGNGFSGILADNIVTFGSYQSRITSATESSITCIVPEMPFPHWHVPITVTTNGVRSKGHASINIDQRVIVNEGFPMR